MSVGSAAGYTNLPNGKWNPSIFSQKVLKFFRRASVAEAITNTDYAGEIENFGDTVKIIKEPTVTVSAYTRGAVVNTEDLTDTEITLTVDQGNYLRLLLRLTSLKPKLFVIRTALRTSCVVCTYLVARYCAVPALASRASLRAFLI
jgi:hypothetical protein